MILWDFDGTLATRDGMWSGAILQAIDLHLPSHPYSISDIRHSTKKRFPWHEPERPWLAEVEPERWWVRMHGIIASILVDLGMEESLSQKVAETTGRIYTDPRGFKLFDDAKLCLERLQTAGFRQCILSNHVPELLKIVEALGLNTCLAKMILKF